MKKLMTKFSINQIYQISREFFNALIQNVPQCARALCISIDTIYTMDYRISIPITNERKMRDEHKLYKSPCKEN